MKEKIGRIARGIIEYELPRILLSSERLSFTVESGKRLNGSVTVSNSAGQSMKGLVYTDNRVIEVITPQFVGVDSTVEYVVHAENLADGYDVAGELVFVTDCGEERLPYRVQTVPPTLASTEGPVRNLKDFAVLAHNRWEEAVRLFHESSFLSFLQFHEPENTFLYEVLCRSNSGERALEEFLVATGKKMEITLQVDRERIEYEVGTTSFSDRIMIVKSNYGHLGIRVTSTSPFLVPEREELAAEHFHNNVYDLRFVLFPEQMGYGNNYASLVIQADNQRIEVPVFCHKEYALPQDKLQKRQRKQLIAKLYENFLAYQMDKLPVSRYVAEAESLLDKLAVYSSDDMPEKRLYRVHLYRLSGKESVANALLRSFTEEEWYGASAECKASYLFLKAERTAGNKAEMMEQLYIMCNEGQRKVLPALLLLRLDERYRKNRKLRFDELRGIYDDGNSSPLLFLEGARVLNEEPALLHEAGDFELQTIAFAVKNGFLQREAALQYSYLEERRKEFRRLSFRVLKELYQQFRLPETLTAICQMLIHARMKESRYAIWFRRGVEEQLRVAELYEYYLSTKEPDVGEEMDPNIYTYFSYNSKLSDKRLAYLYANIVTNKKALPSVYANYRTAIRAYAINCLNEKRIDDFLSILYVDCLEDTTLREEMQPLLPYVAFRYEITCHVPEMRYVCVSHRQLEGEVIVPLIGGVAQVDIFSSDAIITLLDSNNNRYISDEAYEKRRLLHLHNRVSEYFSEIPESTMLLLHLTERAEKEGRLDANSIALRKQACRLPELREEFREDLIRTLVLCYYDNVQDERLEELLSELELRGIPAKQRGKIIGMLIQRGWYERALDLLEAHGYEEVDLRLLEKLCIGMAQETNGRSELLTNLMYYAFAQGRRHERIVEYLVHTYQGTTLALYQLWQEAAARQLDTKDLDERLLAQILFTESYLPYGDAVLRHLDRRGGNLRLIKAFTTYIAYKYLISDMPMGETTVAIMRKHAHTEENDVCILALLKLYSEMEELEKEDIAFAEYWIMRMESHGKVLPAFLKFAKYFKLPESLEDKYLVEYQTNPKHRVTLHYSYRVAGKRHQKDMPMRDICHGIFVKELVLFLGETAEYVISDEDGTEITVSEKVVLQGQPQGLEDSKSRFAQINGIIGARKTEDKDKAIELLNRYIKNEFAIAQLFHAVASEE